jgi:hypothetical protein
LNYATPAPRNDLREIAVRQKAIMFCILGYITLVVLRFVLPPEVYLVLVVVAIGVIITAAVFVFMLAIALYNTGAGIVLGILALVPLVGLLILLIINGRATTELRIHGIKVGLLGANLSQIPA